ncbi:MAG: DUF1499 domain-containing protein [Bauldia sp.]
MMSALREPRSWLSDASARLASLSVPVLVITAISRRTRLIEAAPTYAAMAVGFAIAALAVIAAVAAFMAIWRDGRRGTGSALYGFVLGLLVLAIPAVGAWKIVTYPRLTDISTNPDDPPPFFRVPLDRTADDAPIADPEAEAIALQAEAYPDIVPRHYPVGTARVYEEARAIVTRRRWTLLDASTPSETNEAGRLEAVAVTPLFGFRHDVVILILPDGDGTLVEMRSAARNAAHDLGANAERIRRFFADLEGALQGVGGD